MRALLVALFAWLIALPAFAQDVLVVLPHERFDEIAASLRLELADTDPVTVLETPPDRTHESFAHEQGESRNATHVAWLDFAAGTLRPPMLHIEHRASGQIATVRLPSAYDLMEARAFAIYLASTLHPPQPEAQQVAPAAAPSDTTSQAALPEGPAPALPLPQPRIVPDPDYVKEQWFLRAHAGGGFAYFPEGEDANLDFLRGTLLGGIDFGAYIGHNWRIEGNFLFGAQVPDPGFLFLGGVGFAGLIHFDVVDLILGARVDIAFTALRNAATALGGDGLPVRYDDYFLIGAGAFIGVRRRLSERWVFEARASGDVLNAFLGSKSTGGMSTYSLMIEVLL